MGLALCSGKGVTDVKEYVMKTDELLEWRCDKSDNEPHNKRTII